MSDLEPTGERLLPDHYRGQLVHAEHLARYQLAAQLAAGRRVLDVACGEGYGTAMLTQAGAAGPAVGLDIDQATVDHARERHGVDARQGDLAALPFEDAAFDLVVSFETIEHVEDAERALDELARVRARGGLLLISTPVAGQYRVENEFHLREFGHGEFVAMLEAHFSAVRLLYQHNWLTSAVLDEEALGSDDGVSAVDLSLTKVSSIEPGGELYLVALCGDDVDAELRQVAVMAGTDEAHDLAHRLEDAQRTQEHWAREHEKLSARLVEEAQATAEAVKIKDELLASPSWRVTKPMRALIRSLRLGR